MLTEAVRIYCNGRHAIAVPVGRGLWRCLSCGRVIGVVV